MITKEELEKLFPDYTDEQIYAAMAKVEAEANKPKSETGRSESTKMDAAKAMQNIVHVETRSGFVCDIPRERFDNWKLIRAAIKSGKGDNNATAEYVEIMMDEVLGQKIARDLESHVTVNGRVSFSRLVSECNDIAAGVKN